MTEEVTCYNNQIPSQQKTLLIYTGGTIGMTRSQTTNSYCPDPEYLVNQLANNPLFQHKNLPYFDLVSLNPILDSSNMNFEDVHKIALKIKQYYQQYKAFVVIHGTDTMSYSGSLLSFILQNLQKPVILTGSQIPLCERYSDGYNNLLGALICSHDFNIKEVCIFFNNKLFRANRTQKFSAWKIDAFDSATLEPLVQIGCTQMISCRVKQYKPHEIISEITNQQLHDNELTVTKPSQDVAQVFLYPGFQSDIMLNPNNLKSIKGLVIQAFGAGNGPSDSAFLNNLKAIHDKNQTVIVVVTQTHTGHVDLNCYEAAQPLLDAGCLSGYCMTREAAMGKLAYLIGLGLNQKQIEYYFQQDLKGEMNQD